MNADASRFLPEVRKYGSSIRTLLPDVTTFVASFDFSVMLRLTIATLLGGAIGYEREKAGKIAGLRTHTLVALGAALFTVISILLFATVPSINGVVGYDYHIVANIIVGIGFIGAGTVLRYGDRVSGTTTAASLWVVAAIGMASGFGFYKEAIVTTILAYTVLTLLWKLEKHMHQSVHYQAAHPKEAARALANEKEAQS